MGAPVRLRPSRIVRCLIGLLLLCATEATTATSALSQQTAGIVATPNPVQTEAVFSSNGQYLGDGGVVTVTIGPNSTLLAGQPLGFEECNLGPTSQSQCDGATGQTSSAGTSTPVVPNADGSVTFTMNLWELPTGWTADTYDASDPYTYNQPGFDPGTIIVCDDAVTDGNLNGDPGPGTAHPCSIWVGDDPSNWGAHSLVVNGIQPQPAPDGGEPTGTTTITAPTVSTMVPPPTTTTTGLATTTTSTAGPTPTTTGSELAGGGSSFAGIEMDQWTDDVSSIVPPLEISYTPSSSSNGRTYFRGGLYPYAVSDIAYQGVAASDPAPTFPFEYVPIVAEGLGFMYNLPGEPTLDLDAVVACGIFTGEITNWDATPIAALNPDVVLPDLAITPVLRGDLSGTNWVLEDWCITQAPAVWDSFVDYVNAHNLNVSPPVSLTTPSSAIPVLGNEQTAAGDSGTAAIVGSAEGAGDITYVEPEYAREYGNKPVAYVENVSGDFVQPTPENVSGALAYAAGQPNGIQVLNFNGSGCNVYNPSSYSYLLARTDGTYGTAYGQTLGGFLNFVLTIGEKEAPSIDYSSIGLALEQFGIQQAQNIPGYPALTPEEQSNFVAGDVTPAIVQSAPCGAAFQLALPNTTTTALPTQGQVPEAPSVPLLPLAAVGATGAGLLMVYRWRRRRVGA